MAFRPVKTDVRRWPVVLTFHVCDDAGSVAEIEQSFIGHFAPFTEDQYLALRREIFGDETDESVRRRIADTPVAEFAHLEARFFARLLRGWSHVENDDGTPRPYSAAALDALVTGEDGAVVRAGLNRSLVELRFGMAPRKNAATSPSPGQTPAQAAAGSTS